MFKTVENVYEISEFKKKKLCFHIKRFIIIVCGFQEVLEVILCCLGAFEILQELVCNIVTRLKTVIN